MTSLHLHVIAQVEALQPDALEFWREYAPSPMQSPEWLLAWWSAFRSPNSQLSLVILRDENEQVVGLAPFYMRENWALGRCLRLLGSGRACGDFQTLLTKPGQESAVAEAVGRWLLAMESNERWSFLELEGTTAEDPTLDSLTTFLKQHRCLSRTVDLENTWRLDLQSGWTGFLAGLSKTQRKQVRNFVNRFEKNDDLSVRFVTDHSHILEALQHCMALHQKRWQSQGESGCFKDERFRAFVESGCGALAEIGQAQVALLEHRGQPIASHFYFIDADGNWYMYQSGRDPDRESERIGSVLNAIAIRQACENGVQFIDYLRGDEAYKSRLGALPSKCLRLRLVAPALLPRVRHQLWEFGRDLKNSVQTWRKASQAMAEKTTEPVATEA